MLAPDYNLFATIMQNGFDAGVDVNSHLQNQVSIRVELTENWSEAEDEADIAECEAAGHIWRAYWYANSVGSYSWIAGSFDALVRKELATAATDRDMLVPYKERYPELAARIRS